MLALLRKYQKSLFFVVTVVVVASFLFFGISGSVHGRVREKEFVYGVAIDGSKISGRQIAQLTRFLSTDIDDLLIYERAGVPNLLNDGVINKDVLQSGAGRELFLRFGGGQMHKELEERYKRFKKYTPYEHPQKVLSASMAWQMFGGDSDIGKAWKDFADLDEVFDEKAFATMQRLYLAQKEFPPAILRQILLYQLQQYRGMVQADPTLESGELALFHAKSAQDWFGSQFVELAALFVYNGAIKAEQLGYAVSREEARAALVENCIKGIQKIERNKKVNKAEFSRIMHQQLQALGLEEEEAVRLWQKVLLTRRWLSDVGSGVFIDSQLYQTFHNYTCKGVEIEQYQLPQSLQFATIDDWLKFEIYLEKVAQRDQLLDEPVHYFTVEEMTEKAPELLEKRFLVKVVNKEKDEVAVGVSLRESLEWQLNEANWLLLTKKFPKLAEFSGTSVEEKHDFLLNLPEQEQNAVDIFARIQILDNHPEMIREMLAQAKGRVDEITIPMKAEGNVFRTLANREKLLQLLEEAAREESTGGEEGRESTTTLSCYTEDGKTFYRIRVIERDETFHVMPFEKAKKCGVLDRLLGEKLRASYDKGRWKGDYDEVLPQLKLALVKNIVSAIEKEEKVDGTQFDEIEKRLSFARDHRFAQMMRKKIDEAKSGVLLAFGKGEQEPFSETQLRAITPVQDLFHPVREEKRLIRHEANESLDEKIYDREMGSWSDLVINEGKGALFYTVTDSFIERAPMAQRLKQGREFLSQEVREKILQQFFDEGVQKNAFVVHVKNHADEEIGA